MHKNIHLLEMVLLFATIAASCSKEPVLNTENNVSDAQPYRISQSAANAMANFPLSVSNHRIINSDGLPFLIVGDSPWYLMQRLNREDADKYLENRKSKGVNSLILCMIASELVGSENAYGDNPFLRYLDFSTPNPEYFNH